MKKMKKENLLFMMPVIPILSSVTSLEKGVFNLFVILNYISRIFNIIMDQKDYNYVLGYQKHPIFDNRKFDVLTFEEKIILNNQCNFLLKNKINLYFMYRYVRFLILLKDNDKYDTFTILVSRECRSLWKMKEFKIYQEYLFKESGRNFPMEHIDLMFIGYAEIGFNQFLKRLKYNLNYF